MNGQGGGHFQQLLSQASQAPAVAGFFFHQVAQAVHQLIGVKTQQQVNLITGQLPVVRLAQVACVSPGHFHQLFKETTGKTPGQYLLQARLERARELLIQTHLPLDLVAHQVGFSSQSALTHAFKRAYQQTPGQVRRLH